MKKYLLIILCLTIGTSLSAQIVYNGSIKYEKRSNLKLQTKNTMGDNEQVMKFIEMMPTALSSYYTLYFTPHETMYKFDEHQSLEGMMRFMIQYSPANENVVYRNLQNDSITADKNFFDTRLILAGPAAQQEWQIMEEIREIAGYPCRKAVTTMFDSVVVVAFYTESILPCSGPESVSGLPGMILGLAIPRLYTTWFATEVKLEIPDAEVFQYKFKNKTSSEAEVDAIVEKTMGRMGAQWGVYIKWWLRI